MQISNGYKAGLIGAITKLHAEYYAQTVGFGSAFEAVVATGLAEFIPRLSNDKNQIWHIHEGETLRASIAIDGEHLGKNKAHLRWFIVDESLQGKGIGAKLLKTAINFCDAKGFKTCDLWTFEGLDAARHLYENHGFVLEEKSSGDQWGKLVQEQRFRRYAPE
jgi:GNAT superfamily N-acetyltransferase